MGVAGMARAAVHIAKTSLSFSYNITFKIGWDSLLKMILSQQISKQLSTLPFPFVCQH